MAVPQPMKDTRMQMPHAKDRKYEIMAVTSVSIQNVTLRRIVLLKLSTQHSSVNVKSERSLVAPSGSPTLTLEYKNYSRHN